MSLRFRKTLFIHRRDLRIFDNTALNQAIAQSSEVAPLFIFDPRQVGEKNKYRSPRAVLCMVSALEELFDAYKKEGGILSIFSGEAESVLKEILRRGEIDAVFINADYTPFSKARDGNIQKLCEQYGVHFESHHDLLLSGDPARVLTGNGTSYKVFTPFYTHVASEYEVKKPQGLSRSGVFSARALQGARHEHLAEVKHMMHAQLKKDTTNGSIGEWRAPSFALGRASGLSILRNIHVYARYRDTRDFPSRETTHLSVHHKFGTLSIRESYYALKDAFGSGHVLMRQLYWRDFFTQLSHNFPHVYKGVFNKEFDGVEWTGNRKDFLRWAQGKTGFPIVDAGMRELNETGYMHNRIRMIVASFLTKDLHINWQEGERYFAQKLLDYDPAVNNGSWQWVAGTGADAAPYFRIFNPWIQQKKFDPECVYIKRWIPELSDIPPERIHAIEKKGVPEGCSYPEAMCEHRVETEKAKRLYKIGIKKKY